MPQKQKPVDDWQDTNDWQDVSVPAAKMPTAPPPAGVQANPYKPFLDSVASYIPESVKSGWDWAMRPTTDFASRNLNKAGDFLVSVGNTGPAGDDREWYRDPALYAGEYLHALGPVVDDMTSPLNAGMMLASGGSAAALRRGASGTAKVLSGVNKAANAGLIGTGGFEFARTGDPSHLVQVGMGALGMRSHAPAGETTLELPVPESKPKASFDDIQKRLYELTDKDVAGTLTADELKEAQALNKEWRNHPEFNKPAKAVPEPVRDAQGREIAPPQNEIAARPEGPWNNNIVGNAAGANREYRSMIDNMPDDAIADHITRQEKNPGWNTEVGQNNLAYARQVLEERQANPTVPVNKELPKKPAATNVTPEMQADLELWYKFKKIHDSGKLTPEQEAQWAEVHNRIGDFKANGEVTLQPHRFESLPAEEPKFTEYVLPNGERVNLDTSATKGADTTTFTMKGGNVVEARRADLVPSEKFDPASVGFGEAKPEAQFVDPNTGEIKPASEAKPGDVLMLPDKPTKMAGRKNMILSENTKPEEPVNFNDRTKKPEQTPVQDLPIDNDWTPVGDINASQPDLGGTDPFRKPDALPTRSLAKDIWNTPRSLQSIDLPGITSAALRQSRPLAFTTDWFKAWGQAAKAFGSDEALKAINDDIRASKYFRSSNGAPSVAERIGVKMTDVINNREEAIVSSLAEKIPGYGRYVKASNRAYTGFLNSLRKAKVEQMLDGAIAAGKDPIKNEVLGKDIAKFVNSATGRGDLRALEPVAEKLGLALYSPRALAARLEFMNPVNYVGKNVDRSVKLEYWKSLARIVGSWGAFAGLAKMADNDSVSLDPTNSDFGKIRIGNTRIDPGAGFQQLLVLLAREGAGGTTSSTGKPGEPGKFTPFGSSPYASSRPGLAGRYLYNQLNPSLRFVTDMLYATTDKSKGGGFDLTDRTLQLALPMYVTDIMDAAANDDITAAVFAPLLSSMGQGVQTYDKGNFNAPKITPGIHNLTGIDIPTVQIGGRGGVRF